MGNIPASRLRLIDRLRLAQEIARLVRARLPLELALQKLAAHSSGAFAQSIDAVHERLQSGQSLANSLAHGTDLPTRMLGASIDLGETSGSLDQALDRWATYHIARQRHLHSLASALVYPLLLVLVALISILYSAWQLLPQYQQAFNQLAEVRPQWLIAIEFIERYFGVISVTVVFAVLVVLWRNLGNRQGLDKLGIPRNSALRYLHYSQLAHMSVLGVRSGRPVQTWLGSVLHSVGLNSDDQPADLLASPTCGELFGRETGAVLLGLQAGQLSAADSEKLLAAIGANATVQADLEIERLVQRLPIVTSIIVGAVAFTTYVGLIYLPWVALFYHISRQA